MCFRAIPSNCAPSASSAPRVRSLRRSVLNSTRCSPHTSNARSHSKSFVSTFAPVPQAEGRSHVQPISTRRWWGSKARYRVEPASRPAATTANATSSGAASASSNQTVEVTRIGHVAEDLRILGRRLAQALAVPLLERLHADERARERAVGAKLRATRGVDPGEDTGLTTLIRSYPVG